MTYSGLSGKPPPPSSLTKLHAIFLDFLLLKVLVVLLCRFPDLRHNESQIYSQEDVQGIIAYARDRGIRVIPEVESGCVELKSSHFSFYDIKHYEFVILCI